MIGKEYIIVKRSRLQNQIVLDSKFGWFLGAYLAEGNCIPGTVSITNVNIEFEKHVAEFAKSLGLGYRVTEKLGSCPSNKDKIYKSKSYHISSMILSDLIVCLCGTGSSTKKVPDFVFGANKEFIACLLRGYMDGDGNISTGVNKEIRAHSICLSLLQDLRVLFMYFGIYTTLHEQTRIKKIKDSYKTVYQLTIYGNENAKIYLEEIGTDLDYKNEALLVLANREDNFNGRIERIHYDIGKRITRISSKLQLRGHSRSYARYERLKDSIGKVTLKRMINLFEETAKIKNVDISEDLHYCYQAINADIIWDKIINIEIIKEKDYLHKYVYDFSVKENETFALFSGIVVHNTLNTFHKAGQSEKAVVAGVPRMNELLNATKEPKIVSSKIYFKKHHSSIQDLKKTISHNLVELSFAKISNRMKICMNKEEEKWYKTFKVLYSTESWYKDVSRYQHCISIDINIDYLYEYHLTFEDIAAHIESQYDDLACIFSPLHLKQFDVFVDTSSITLPEDRLLFITADNAPEIYLEEVVQTNLENMIVAGVPGIQYMYFIKENDEWIVETDGANLVKLLAQPFIDETRTVVTNVWDIYHVFGIEAAREFLIQEFMAIMDGINSVHVVLLCERMTFAGSIASISRYTMKKDEGSCLSKSSFECSVENFVSAAINGETEPTRGVSASIICAKRSQIGTGMMELRVDMDNLPKVFSYVKDIEDTSV
jgi:DNA-directed RNA polymerase subunit A"